MEDVLQQLQAITQAQIDIAAKVSQFEKEKERERAAEDVTMLENDDYPEDDADWDAVLPEKGVIPRAASGCSPVRIAGFPSPLGKSQCAHFTSPPLSKSAPNTRPAPEFLGPKAVNHTTQTGNCDALHHSLTGIARFPNCDTCIRPHAIRLGGHPAAATRSTRRTTKAQIAETA